MKFGRSIVLGLRGRQAQAVLAKAGVSTSKGLRVAKRKDAKRAEEIRRLDAEIKALR